MRLDLSSTDPAVRVALSRRNLLALLSKLELPWSARTIHGGYCYLDGELIELRLVLVAEPDEVHYADREPPGVMHPATEALITSRARRRNGGSGSLLGKGGGCDAG